MPVPEDTDHGAAGPEAVPGGAQPGGGNWAATSSLSTGISIQWKLQHVGSTSTSACFDTKQDANVVFGAQAWLYHLLCPTFVLGIGLNESSSLNWA